MSGNTDLYVLALFGIVAVTLIIWVALGSWERLSRDRVEMARIRVRELELKTIAEKTRVTRGES